MKKNKFLAPAKIRLILSITLILGFVLIVGNFYVAYREVDKIAGQVAEKVAQANNSRDTLQNFQKLDRDLKTNQEIVEKAKRITADTQNYFYQDQLINDLTTYATRSGMIINDITFSPQTGGESTQSVAPTDLTTPAPSIMKATTVTVSLKSPVNYRQYLNFLHYIEQNLTKLKIASVTLTKGDDDTVTTGALNLEVYLR